jgi:hypothetical protein
MFVDTKYTYNNKQLVTLKYTFIDTTLGDFYFPFEIKIMYWVSAVKYTNFDQVQAPSVCCLPSEMRHCPFTIYNQHNFTVISKPLLASMLLLVKFTFIFHRQKFVFQIYSDNDTNKHHYYYCDTR